MFTVTKIDFYLLKKKKKQLVSRSLHKMKIKLLVTVEGKTLLLIV
jgi:hypothetical protein